MALEMPFKTRSKPESDFIGYPAKDGRWFVFLSSFNTKAVLTLAITWEIPWVYATLLPDE